MALGASSLENQAPRGAPALLNHCTSSLLNLAHEKGEIAAGMTLIAAIDFGDAVQYVQPSGLPHNVSMVIPFVQEHTRVVIAVCRRDLFQFIEQLVQFSLMKPPLEQVTDLLCWSERLV